MRWILVKNIRKHNHQPGTGWIEYNPTRTGFS